MVRQNVATSQPVDKIYRDLEAEALSCVRELANDYEAGMVIDYSKFDNIGDSDSDDEPQQRHAAVASTPTTTAAPKAGNVAAVSASMASVRLDKSDELHKLFRTNTNVGLRCDPKSGRTIYANADMAAGAFAFTALPFAVAISDRHATRACHVCLRGSEELPNMFRCGDCKWAIYCSKECMQLDAAHGGACPALHAIGTKRLPIGGDGETWRLVCAALCWRMLESRPLKTAQAKPLVSSDLAPQFSNVNALMSHMERAPVSERRALENDAAHVFKLLHPSLLQGITPQFVVELFLRCKFNVQPIYDEHNAYTAGGGPVGIGLYPAMAMCNHGCNPNAIVVPTNPPQAGAWPQLSLRLLRGVTSNDDLCYGYIDPLQPRQERRAMLADAFAFECQCSRCNIDSDIDSMTTLVCGRCKSVLPCSGPDVCPSCGHKGGRAVGEAQVSSLTSALTKAAAALSPQPKEAFSNIRQALRDIDSGDRSGRLADGHWLRIDAGTTLVAAAKAANCASAEVADVAKMTKAAMSAALPGPHRQVLSMASIVAAANGDAVDAKALFESAISVVSVASAD